MRHYFFEMDDGNTVAFFEVATGMETFAKPAGGPSDRAIQLDHLSFNVPDEYALELLRKRLLAAGSEVTTVVDHGIMRSVYFHDPNGIALEASWWVTDPTGRPTDYTDDRVFADPRSGARRRELAAAASSHSRRRGSPDRAASIGRRRRCRLLRRAGRARLTGPRRFASRSSLGRHAGSAPHWRSGSPTRAPTWYPRARGATARRAPACRHRPANRRHSAPRPGGE